MCGGADESGKKTEWTDCSRVAEACRGGGILDSRGASEARGVRFRMLEDADMIGLRCVGLGRGMANSVELGR